MYKLKKKGDNLNISKTSSQIVSPIAKYDVGGNLICVICKSTIKSVALWKVHINSKLHKLKLKETKDFSKSLNVVSSHSTIQSKVDTAKKSNQDSINNLNMKEIVKLTTVDNVLKKTTNSFNKGATSKNSFNILPDMFFDDVDKKLRNNICEDEWDKFQREIKEESVTSKNLVAGEQNNSAVQREIIEINEQICHWSKVLDLEQKFNEINNVCKRSLQNNYFEENLSDDDDFDENLDWRSKKLF